MKGAYYNEIDAHCAAWLRSLIAGGFIPAGDVDERDVRDVRPAELAGYRECHFFAGIGLWPLALRWGGWGAERPVWTGSCPCQPFSQGGRRKGFADERHLWPAWFHLIRERRPATIFGEQVASADGRMWFDLVHADLESLDYAAGAADLCSAGVGAPNIRQRLYWVAHTESRGRREHGVFSETVGGRKNTGQPALVRAFGGLASTNGERCSERRDHNAAARHDLLGSGGAISDPWRELEWIECTDTDRKTGKRRWRPTKPGLFPLAPRHPGDVAKLRAYGNAINPVVASRFVAAFIEAEKDLP